MSGDGFQELRQQAVAAGCFEARPGRAVAAVFANAGAAAGLFVLAAHARWFLAAPLFVLGSLVFYRLGWLMHDGAHGGVFQNARKDRLFALLTCLLLGEFPSGWQHGHNRHHASPNVRGLDGDQSERWDPERVYESTWGAFVGLLLFSKAFGVVLPKTLLLLGLRDGYYAYRFRRERFRVELAVVLVSHALQLAFFCTLGGAVGPLLWLANTAVGMVYLNAVFAGNHYDLAVFDESNWRTVDFAQLQIVTTRNYTGGFWTHFWCGGLEMQIEHHLFPNMPRRGLRKAGPLVRAYCERRGLPYGELSFVASIRRVLHFHVRGKRAPQPQVA